VLGEVRTINVYTPPEYASDTAAFPVLYMLDGGMSEDFPHVANTIDSLIRLGLIPPVLVVGIENTERRRDLTGPTTVAKDSAIAPRVGGSAAFRSFIRDELIGVWWNGGEAVRAAHSHIGALRGAQRVLYLAAANEPQIAEATAELAAILKAQSADLVLFYAPRPDLAHDTIFRALAPSAFSKVLGEGVLDPD